MGALGAILQPFSGIELTESQPLCAILVGHCVPCTNSLYARRSLYPSASAHWVSGQCHLPEACPSRQRPHRPG